MGPEIQSRKPQRDPRTGRAKVKTGCRTCKLRRVKCDEERPVCGRCFSAGRVCEGYGVWGGGGLHGHRQASTPSSDRSYSNSNSSTSVSTSPRPRTCISILAIDVEEGQHYDWFRCRTATKIPGMFISASFWHTVVFQACQSEPAVLHAALTLSCVHRGGISTDQTPEFCDDNLDDQETFVLRQYLKAISHLSPLLAKRDRSSIRIALVACVLFVCLEFLRGHFQTAQVHLQNGLKVLAEQQAGGTTRADTGILSLQAHGEPVDDHIVEALYRLHVQVELFNCTYQRPGLVLQRPGPSFLPSRFSTVREASKEMDRLLNKVFALSQRAFQQQASQGLPVQGPSTLNNCQQHIQAELKAWLDTFKASAETLQKEAQTKAFVYQLLKGYHAMASIMAGTCLRGYDESVFDSYTEQFVTIIDLFSQHREMRPVPVLSQAPGQRLNMARSVIDIGWIPPLYYTALKCRVHRVRLQAVQLLESTSHREGIWDSKIAACVARKVMDLEEGASNGGIGVRDNLEPFNSPSRNDTLLFTVPQRRINDVEVVLPNSCADGPMLVCRQRSHTEDCKEWAERYDSIGERWVKVSLGQYSSTQHL